jgi:hypothetical protein
MNLRPQKVKEKEGEAGADRRYHYRTARDLNPMEVGSAVTGGPDPRRDLNPTSRVG